MNFRISQGQAMRSVFGRSRVTHFMAAPFAWVCLAWPNVVPEATLEKTELGLAPRGNGWYVLNMRDAEWRHADGRGAVCVVGDDFEGWRRQADQLGFNPFVLEPGEAMSMYHWETDQEAFLVVSG